MKMLKKNKLSIALIISLMTLLPFGLLQAQADDIKVKGIIVDSGTGKGLEMASISVASTGYSTSSDSVGEFTVIVPDLSSELIINLPGYSKRNIFLSGSNTLEIYLVDEKFKSTDDIVITNLDRRKANQLNFSYGSVEESDIENTTVSSFDQALQGKVAGLSVIQKSATPGQNTYMNIRGASSLLAENTPVVIIDGMIHNYANVAPSLIEGFALNPLEIVDVDDIQGISVMKDGVSYLGSIGSGGVINVSTEQESETSTRIKFSAYGGLALSPKQQSVLSADEYPGYLSDVLTSQGLSQTEVDATYPWLNGQPGDEDYYRYHNSTNWQDIVFDPAFLQKYHFFLKGGDEIATYNISAGYINQEGIYDNSAYNRFNLRVNGIINISQRFSIQPNVKLSYANSEVHNQGYTSDVNPLTSALLKPSIATTHGRDELTGLSLPYLQDVGFADVSNPQVVVNDPLGSVVNYTFLSSVKANFAINDNFNISTLVGIDYGNTHEDIFLPDNGLATSDTLKTNSPGYAVNEFQSVQNNTNVTYSNQQDGHSYIATAGLRYMSNKYKYSSALDYNTASDAIDNIGSGGSDLYLRELDGEQRSSVWLSYYGGFNYNYRNTIFLETNFSYDGSSALDGDNRFNFYPSVAAGYQMMPELKLRASYAMTGNMFSTIYDYSQLYYVGRMYNSQGVIVREAIPNPDMEIEKKSTYNLGVDLTMYRQRLNIFVDLYQSNINNLLMNQSLDQQWGYTNYVDNGGRLRSRGVELGLNTRLNVGEVIWTVGATAAYQSSEITELNFLSSGVDHVVTDFVGGSMITKEGEAPNVFYGYTTEGIYQTDAVANLVTGPNGPVMQAGDVIYSDVDGNNIINSDDMSVIGDPNPDVFGGFYTSFKYNNLQVSAQINYSIGNDAFNYVKYLTESMSDYTNQSTSVNDRWTAEGTSNSIPRVSYGDPTGNTVFSDRWIEDASYVRLKDITVSYDMPSVLGFRSWTVYATATNLLTLTKYSGYDPEFMYSNNMYNKGVDYGQMPQTKKFIVGIKLDL